jgi:class 3 adenylate cyclase
MPPSSTATHTPAPSPALPSSFAGGRYIVRSFLGEGGRKKVYLAHDTKLDRDVAVAVIKTDGLDEAGLSRVKREAQAMGKLGDHPNIVTIHDIGDDGGQPYIVSQYMGGGDLEAVLNKAPDRRLSIPETMRIAQQVVLGLAHAHSRGIIHRDLKPGNIWLTEDGTPKIGDFGLAVSLDRSRLTMEGMMVGTVAYMAPEQALGRAPDARSDIYSLGCVTYEMVTGRPPFLGDDPVAIISQHINTAAVAPSWHNPEVPRALEALILRSLAKDPDERPESAASIPEAFQAIVNSSSTTTAAAAESDANPLDRLAGGIFVGRDKEMDELRAGLEDALSGRGRLMMLVGEPGIGKTRTSEEFATYARLRNAQVVWGRCYEGEGAPAYWPWVQAIRSYVHEREPQQLMSEMGPGAADIAQVVSEVKERLPGLPVPPNLEPERARFRLFDSITTFLKNASGQKPMVLVLDDLHWGDKPSLLLLQFLARELRGSRLLVLGTYRDVELRRQHPLSQTLGELGREGLSHRIILRGLSENDVARFVEITSGAKPPQPLVDAVFRETEGNPFFVNEIVRLLVADGRLDKPESVTSWSVTIPQGVREVVGRRLDHLSDECNRVLTIGSVIGREFDLKTVEKVLAQAEEGRMSSDRLIEVLEEAVAARVITEVPGKVDSYSFAHALIRETLYEELSTTRRVRLHRQIGEGLEVLDAEGNLPQLAYHFAEAAPGGDVEKAVDYAERAAERAKGQVAYEEAAAQYERALQALELATPVDEERRCELLLTLGQVVFKAGDPARSRQALDGSIELARTLKDSERLARAVAAYEFNFFEIGKSQEKIVALVEEALAAIGENDSLLRVELLISLGRELGFSAARPRSVALALEAVDVARRLGDPAMLSRAISHSLGNSAEPGNNGLEEMEKWLGLANEAVELAELAGDRFIAMTSRISRMVALMALGDISAMDRDIEAFTRLAEELREPSWLWAAATFPAGRALLDGRMDDAERLALAALAAGQRTEQTNATGFFGAQMFAIRREQARLAEMEPLVRGLMQQFPGIPAWRTALALLHAELGREKEALEEFEILAADNFSLFPRDTQWPITLALLAEVCGFLGDSERAAQLYEHLRPLERICIVVGVATDCYGPTSRPMGRLAATMGRWDDAERHFEDALERSTKMGSGRWATRTQLQYAQMLAARDGPNDRQRALALLAQALETAPTLGLIKDMNDCLALKLQLQGVSSTDVYTSIDAVARAVQSEHPDLKKHASPDGTVTIMFSDIEGSTAMADRLGDKRFMDVLREHNAIIREQVKSHGGFEVKSEGDGFMVAFQSAGKALACASAIQKALLARNESAVEPVKVRMGLHAGEVIKEGEDFFGRNVIMAARVASQANGGEILASAVLKGLLAGSDVTWGPSRMVALKGLSGEHEIWAVDWRA